MILNNICNCFHTYCKRAYLICSSQPTGNIINWLEPDLGHLLVVEIRAHFLVSSRIVVPDWKTSSKYVSKQLNALMIMVSNVRDTFVLYPFVNIQLFLHRSRQQDDHDGGPSSPTRPSTSLGSPVQTRPSHEEAHRPGKSGSLPASSCRSLQI